MSLNLGKLGISKIGQLWRNVRPFARDDLDRLFGVTRDMNIVEKKIIVDDLWKWMEEVRKALSSVSEGLDISYSASNLLHAYQRLTIVAGDISTTEVTDDTVTTKSETNSEFNWLDSRRINIVVLGPVQGNRPMKVIFDADRILEDTDDYAGTVFPTAATTLQRMNFDGADWVGIAWEAGWTIDMYQIWSSNLQELASP